MKATNVILILGFFCSCTKTGHNHNIIDKEVADIDAKTELTLMNVTPESKPTVDSEGHVRVLQFDDLTITTEYEEVWNDENYFTEIHKDTIIVQLGLVSKISGQAYLVKTGAHIRDIQIFQNYETSLTIMDEGPHVDLTEWKHFVGEWKKLKIEGSRFKTLEYSTDDQEQFPNVTSDEILQATKKHLNVESNRWTDLAQQCTGVNAYPCGVSISRINLKIVLTDINGVASEKYVILEVPMGC